MVEAGEGHPVGLTKKRIENAPRTFFRAARVITDSVTKTPAAQRRHLVATAILALT